MRPERLQELLGALIIILIGAAFMYFGSGLRFGSAANMGPGYLPRILSALLLLIGVILAIRALIGSLPKPAEWPSWRATLVVVACPIVFGLLVPRIGLAISLVITVLLSKLAQKQRWGWESIVTAVGLSVFCSLVFVTFLKMPVNLWP